MDTVLLIGLKVAFLGLLWVFIFYLAQVIRTDLFGRRMTADELVSVAGAQDAAESRSRRRTKQASPQPVQPTVLRVTEGPSAGNVAMLPEGEDEIMIGRAASADLEIDDDFASSRHALLYGHAQGYVIEDLGSTNGVYVNGVQIEGPTIVGPEDAIRIGRTQLRLEAR